MACCDFKEGKVDNDDLPDRDAEGGGGQDSEGTFAENHVDLLVGSPTASDSAAGQSHSNERKGGRYDHAQEEHLSSGSGATEAISEIFIPVGQSSEKHDFSHLHQFAAHEPSHRIAKGSDPRHCDIAGHEHSQCCACHKLQDHALHHNGDSCDNNRLHVVRTLSFKKAIRVQQVAESSDWAPTLKHPNASYSAEKRNRASPEGRRRIPRSSKQKGNMADWDSSASHSSAETTYRGILKPKPPARPRGVPSEKLRGFVSGVAVGSTSSQLPQTSISSLARARSKETLSQIRPYRRVSELPYAPGCSICQTKDDWPLAQTKEAARKERRKDPDEELMRQVPSFQAQMQAAAVEKKRENELLESQLRRDLHAAQEKLRGRGAEEQDQQGIYPISDLHSAAPQAGQNFGDLRDECDYLREELKHMKKHLKILNRQGELLESSSDHPVYSTRFESAQKLVADLRSTLEESQTRLLQLEESHEKHEGDFQIKLKEMQDREAKLLTQTHESANANAAQDRCDVLQNERDAISLKLEKQKELAQKWQEECESRKQKLIIKEQKIAEIEEELRSKGKAAQERCDALQHERDAISLKLEKHKELAQRWQDECESREQKLVLKDQKLSEMEEELRSKDKAASELSRDLDVHRETLSSKDLILSALREEHQQSRESLQAKGRRLSELEKSLQQARKELESREMDLSWLEKELQEHREQLSSKVLIATKLDEDLQHHRQSLLVKDQSIFRMETALKEHKRSLLQTEENARSLQKDLVETEQQLREALEKNNYLEEKMRNVAEEDRVRVDEVITELDITKRKLNDVVAELETETEKASFLQAKLDAEAQEGSMLRKKSLQDLRDSQEQLQVMQSQLDEEKSLRLNSAKELQEALEKVRALEGQLDTKMDEVQCLRSKSDQSLRDTQEQIRALERQLDETAEEQKKSKAISAKELQEVKEQLMALKELQAQTEVDAEEDRKLRRKAEQALQQAQGHLESQQADMKREIGKEQNLRISSLIELHQTQEQLEEINNLKAHIERKLEEEHRLRRKSELDLEEQQQKFLAEREHMAKKQEEEKHVRRKSLQDLQDTQEKLHKMQQEHNTHTTITTEKLNSLLAQRADFLQQLETIQNEKRLLESDHQQALLQLEMIRNAFSGLRVTVSEHDLCVDFVEDVEGVLKDLHTKIDDHKKKEHIKEHTRREDYFDSPDQGDSIRRFSGKQNSAGKMLRDLRSMIDAEAKQRLGTTEDHTDDSEQGFSTWRREGDNSRDYSTVGSSVFGDISSPTRTRSLLRPERNSAGIGTDFTQEAPNTEASDVEEDPMNPEELKEVLEERLEDLLSTLGVKRNSETLSDDMYEKLVTQRSFHRRRSSRKPEVVVVDKRPSPDSSEVDVMDTLNTFDQP